MPPPAHISKGVLSIHKCIVWNVVVSLDIPRACIFQCCFALLRMRSSIKVLDRCSLSSHDDAINCLCCHPSVLWSTLASQGRAWGSALPQKTLKVAWHLCAGDEIPYQYPIVDVHVPERATIFGQFIMWSMVFAFCSCFEFDGQRNGRRCTCCNTT